MDGLQGLASRLEGVAAVTLRGTAPPAFDTHVALMSLPHTLGPRALARGRRTCARATLASRRNGARAWPRQGHAPGRELAIGLAWAGNPALRNSRERSPGFAAVRGLVGHAPACAASRCKRAPAAPISRAHRAAAQLRRPRPTQIADFDDTAAVIANLDLVVTCDTAVAHLAGALGKPVFVMLPHTPDWRYGLDPTTPAPGIPSMRLFRQARRGDWTDVLARISHALVAGSRITAVAASRRGACLNFQSTP